MHAPTFALGAVLTVLARRRAFTGETTSEIETAILREEPPELATIDSRIPSALERIARRCLEKRPEDRFESARDVAFALEAVATTTGSRRRREARPRGAPAPAALLLGLAMGALTLAALRRPPSPPSYTKLTFRRGAILSARFVHDGQTVVYSAAWDGQPAQVFATRIGSGEARALDLEGVVLAVSSRDELAVKGGGSSTGAGQRRSGTLARVSLAGGAPRPGRERDRGRLGSVGSSPSRRVEGVSASASDRHVISRATSSAFGYCPRGASLPSRPGRWGPWDPGSLT
jgi:hypothetical protein